MATDLLETALQMHYCSLLCTCSTNFDVDSLPPPCFADARPELIANMLVDILLEACMTEVDAAYTSYM